MTKTRNAIIGERVRFYRTSKSMNLSELGRQLAEPIVGQQIARYETAESRWPADIICEIALLLKIDVRVLLGMETSQALEKGSPEWEAEKYKNAMLSLPPEQRKLCYNTIDGLVKLNDKEN